MNSLEVAKFLIKQMQLYIGLRSNIVYLHVTMLVLDSGESRIGVYIHTQKLAQTTARPKNEVINVFLKHSHLD